VGQRPRIVGGGRQYREGRMAVVQEFGGGFGPRMPMFGRRGPGAGPRTTFALQIGAHSYRVFQCQ